MSVLFFSDLHLGVKTHSIQDSQGLTNAEIDARTALNVVYERARADDINMMVCCGDTFHTPHPTTRNIETLIEWLYKMDGLNKPFYLITGNHDSGVYSNSMIFTKQLKLQNTTLVDSTIPEDAVIVEGRHYYFVPFITSSDSSNKNRPVFDLVTRAIQDCQEPAVIVAHVYDSEVTVGSESQLISRYTETVDFSNFSDKDITMVLGHAHKAQTYSRSNGIRIIYPGSLYFTHSIDANQSKGYMVFTKDGKIEFEKIRGIREFVSYTIPDNTNVLDFINTLSLQDNSHVFLESPYHNIDQKNLQLILNERGCSLGGIKYSTKDNTMSEIEVKPDNTSSYDIFSDFLKKYLENIGAVNDFDSIFNAGCNYIDGNFKKEVNNE